MLITPILSRYRHGDFVQYINNLLELVTDTRATTLNIAPQRTILYDNMQHFNEIWQPTRGSELTPQIATLDDRRDKIFSGFKTTVDTWAKNHYDDEYVEAAYLLSDNIAAHGKEITKMRYQQQTAVLNAILNDMEGEFAPQVNLLGLTQWVNEIRTVNTQFDELYLQRTQILATQQDGTVEAQREQVTTNFKTLKSLFESRMEVAQVDEAANLQEFQTVHDEWNALTEQYNDAVTRHTQTNDTEEPDEQDETPTENQEPI